MRITKTNIYDQALRRGGMLAVCLAFTASVAISFLSVFMPQNAGAISNETRPTLVGREIRMGEDGGHIIMQGVNIWGVETVTMDGFGNDQWNDRVNIVNTVKSWGANHVRFRLQASDYNNETFMTKADYLNRINIWHDLITGAGMYFMPVWWDGHDGPYSDANWPTQYSQAFPMMTDVMNLFQDDPMVLYEPFNEPTGNVNDVQWVAAMEDTISHFRDNGYTGILLIDPRVWAHCYDDSDFTAIEQHDAAQAGMNGTHQIIFSKHDYAREYTDPDAGFDETEWTTNAGGCEDWDTSKHAVWETEFGNYSLDPSSVHPNWSEGAAEFLHDNTCSATGAVTGATAFLFGPWLDSNAMTAADNTTKTTWGDQIDGTFLAPCAGNPLNGIGTLGNLVFFDNNKDGIFNSADGDTELDNVTLALYSQATSTCSVPGGATPLATQTTDSTGHYQFTLLPTDDGNITNGAGARYAVVITDDNDVLGSYEHIAGTAGADNNSQQQPAFCAELTNTVSDLQYADFGYVMAAVDPTDPSDPTTPPSGGDSGTTDGTAGNNDDSLAETGQPIGLLVAGAAALVTASIVTALYGRKLANKRG